MLWNSANFALQRKRIRWTLKIGLRASTLKYRSHPPTFHWIKEVASVLKKNIILEQDRGWRG